jgi:MinD superfamily P-loop ATPase
VKAAIASGKGGTGKTTVSAALASVWAEVWHRPVAAVDLDVEEPNLHLFLRPRISRVQKAVLEIPVIDEAICTRCGACRELCQFGAVTILGDTPMVFAEMCHGCGGCRAVCPVGAVSAGEREIGQVEEGLAGDLLFLGGRLRVGEAMSPPLIRTVMARLAEHLAEAPSDAVLDAPPGTSCPAGAAVAQADCIVLVTEPTPFGVHDFRLAVESFAPLGKPMAVVINRAGSGDDTIYAVCREANLPILAEIPDDRAVAETYARGGLLPEVGPAYRQACLDLALAVGRLAKEAPHA